MLRPCDMMQWERRPEYRVTVIHGWRSRGGDDLRWRSLSDYCASCANPFQSKVMPWPGRVGANAMP